MIPTLLHHRRTCSQGKGVTRQAPQSGVSLVLFKCIECGVVASSPKAAK